MEEKTKTEELRRQYDAACNAYLDELLRMWELDGCYGYWNSDRPGTMYHYGETHNLSMENITYIVDNAIGEDEVLAWEDYLLDAGEYGFTLPNLESWHNGCPRTPQEVFDRLSAMHHEIDNLVEEEKERQEVKRDNAADHDGSPC